MVDLIKMKIKTRFNKMLMAMMLYLIRVITDITCRPGTCDKWDSNSPFVVDDDDAVNVVDNGDDYDDDDDDDDEEGVRY